MNTLGCDVLPNDIRICSDVLTVPPTESDLSSLDDSNKRKFDPKVFDAAAILMSLDVVSLDVENSCEAISTPHHYGGFDIYDVKSNGILWLQDPDVSEGIKECTTYTHGSGNLWYFKSKAGFNHSHPNKRFICDWDGSPLFIRSVSISKLNKHCHSHSIAFLKKKTEGWHFGIIQHIYNIEVDGDGSSIELWRWIGDTSENDVPLLFYSHSWNEMKHYLIKETINVNQITFFLESGED